MALNERAVLRLVQSRRATSQVEIAKRLSAPTATVHSLVKRLQRQRIIEQCQIERGRKGRPVQHYRLRLPGPMLAVRWLGTDWHGGLIHPDPRHDIIKSWTTESVPDAGQALAVLLEHAKSLASESGLRTRDLAGCAVFLNAARLPGTGRFTSSVIPWAGEIDADRLARALGCSTRVLEAPGVAEAEIAVRARDGAPGLRSLVVFNVGDGVSAHGCWFPDSGSGVETLRGEIGHVMVDAQGPMCGCGRRGCLEALISGPALQRRLRADIADGVATALAPAARRSPRSLYELLAELVAERRDAYSLTLVEEFWDRCAWALSVIEQMFGPDVIVLGGYAFEGREDWRCKIEELASPKFLFGDRTDLRIEFPRTTQAEQLRRMAETAFLAD